MAVIIPNMAIPKSCSECPMFYDYMSCSITSTHADFENMCNERLKDCPLKSADEMITEIRDYSNKYTTINVNTKKVVVEVLLCIIHKYCDKELTDGSNTK